VVRVPRKTGNRIPQSEPDNRLPSTDPPHVLRGTIIAGRAGRSVSAIRGRDVLQDLQMPEGAFAYRSVARKEGTITRDVLRTRITA
jgi:hypothetical protein